MIGNKQRTVNTFYSIKNASKEVLEKTCKRTIGQPVWDDIKLKTRQIGVVVDASYTHNKILGNGLCITIELNDMSSLETNKSLLRGVSIGGDKK